MDQPQRIYSALLNRLQLEDTLYVDLAWPQLSSQNQMKHIVHKNVQRCKYDSNASTSSEMFTQESLNNSEYSELGQKEAKVKSTSDQYVSQYKSIVAETTITYVKNKVRRKTFSERYRRSKSMFLDFSKALETAECFINGSRKESGKLKFNICKVKANGSNTNKSNKINYPLRKNKFRDITLKKSSRLKRRIMVERSNNMKRKLQNDVNARKIEDNIVNVNSINLNSLKIQSDLKEDINYVKRMSTLNICDTNYRHSIAENISEDTVQYCPDLTQKLDELKISNIQDKNISISPYRNSVDDTNDLNVLLNSNLSLTDEDNVDIKPNINCVFDVILDILKSLKEVQKHIMLKKVRFVVIAPNNEKILSAGSLNEEVDKLLEICRKNKTVFCFGLRRRKLGYYAHGNGFVSCIGVSNYANAEEFFWNIEITWKIEKNGQHVQDNSRKWSLDGQH